VAFLDPEIDFWGVKFPSLTDSEVRAIHLLLECSSCKGREAVDQSDLAADVFAINEHLNSDTAMRIFSPYDVIIDGTDNFPTRYLANDAAHFLAKPLVHGSIFRFEGRLAMFDSAKGTGCYRCLFPEPPPPGSVQSCAEAGVFGVLPGIIGSMMAFETIKYLLDIGRPMIGRYLLFEGEDLSFRELKLRQNKACPLCGENPTFDSLIDYEAWCGTPAMEPSEARAS